jgi:enamine deaminase RidA (YjgF/YER057c/UK114 family)
MRQAYVNVGKALAEFGLTMKDVVEEQIFVTDMRAALAVAAKVRRSVYNPTPATATSVVQVGGGLALPQALIGIKVTAKLAVSTQPQRGGSQGT